MFYNNAFHTLYGAYDLAGRLVDLLYASDLSHARKKGSKIFKDRNYVILEIK